MVTYGGNRPKVKDDEVLTAQDFNDATRFWVTDELPDNGEDGDVVFVVGDEPSGGGINVESQRKHQLLQGNDSKGWVPGMAMSVVDALPADDAEGYAIGDVVFVTGPGDGGSSTSTDAPGLVHLHTEVFDNVTNLHLNDAFSSEYEFYKIQLSFISSANVDLRYQWKDGSGNLGESLYDTQIAVLVAAYEQDRIGDASYGKLVRNTGGYTHTLSMELSGLTANGQANQSPTLVGNSFRTNSMFSFGSTYKKSGSVTGMRIWPNSGTWSGTVSVYGYSKGGK